MFIEWQQPPVSVDRDAMIGQLTDQPQIAVLLWLVTPASHNPLLLQLQNRCLRLPNGVHPIKRLAAFSLQSVDSPFYCYRTGQYGIQKNKGVTHNWIRPRQKRSKVEVNRSKYHKYSDYIYLFTICLHWKCAVDFLQISFRLEASITFHVLPTLWSTLLPFRHSFKTLN